MSLLAYFVIGMFAILPIYAGSHAALRRPATAPMATSEQELEEENSFAVLESLSRTDAMLFPILGGCVLGAMYLTITYISQEWLSYLLSVYFAILGIVANSQMLSKLGCYMYPSLSSARPHSPQIGKQVPDNEEQKDRSDVFDMDFSLLNVCSGILSVLLSMYYMSSKNWIASNILGLSFSFSGIQLIAVDSFQTGIILLSGLFIYDIYFVFGTEIMLTVAKGIKAPMMVMFPKDILHDPNGPATMLGLGDIVIPGLYIALCLRYDLSEYHRLHPGVRYMRGFHDFRKHYFAAAMWAYIIGLSTTIGVMHSYKTAQPALLYLSPACISSTLITAWRKQDATDMWAYKDKEAQAAFHNSARISGGEKEK